MNIDDNIIQYCKNYSMPDEDILNKLTDYTFRKIDAANMISGNMVGNLLYILSTSINARRVLDVGMFTGYSALKLASSIPSDGEVHTFELADNHIQSAQKFFSESQYNNITIHQGEALKNLETLQAGTFDFAFIDADKINYINYYDRCMMLIRNGGIIVLDNMLWSGKVLNPEDEDSIALNQAAKYINNDDRVFNHMLTIRDGLMVCIKNG
jgi:caffeoyl-CoA O-methyltransferase